MLEPKQIDSLGFLFISQQVYLSQSNIPLHIHGHHHRFAIDRIGSNTLSIGLRNLELAQNDQLIPGSFALLNWQDRTNFAIYSDQTSLSLIL